MVSSPDVQSRGAEAAAPARPPPPRGAAGWNPENYFAYAEPLDGPLLTNDVRSLGRVNPGAVAINNFTTRFATTSATRTLTITKTAGDNQKGNIGNVLPIPLEVAVQDSLGNPVAGISVSFTGSRGGGTVVPFRVTTDVQGKARARAYLGTGTLQTFRAYRYIHCDASLTFFDQFVR